MNEDVMLVQLLQEKNEPVYKLEEANTKLKSFESEREWYSSKQEIMEKDMSAMETKHGETVDRFTKKRLNHWKQDH